MEHNNAYFNISPNGANLLEGFQDHPDELLQLLQIPTNYTLTSEQSVIAKMSALEIAHKREICILDLVELWQDTPSLSNFAARLRRVFLPESSRHGE